MVPEVAKSAAKVTLFQRTAHWIWNNPSYHAEVPEGEKWCLKHLPFYANWYRFYLFWGLTDGFREWYKIDENWPHQDRSINAMNDKFRTIFSDNIKRHLGDRSDLIDKVTPKYPPFADRICVDNGNYLQTLTRDNVELVTSGVAEVDETGITDEHGGRHDVDVIIYATGFHVQRYLFPIRFIGRDGLSLNDFWNGEARAFLGVTVPNFPNLFILWGPGTSAATGGSVIFLSECQARYTLGGIEALVENDLGSIECTKAAFDRYVDAYKSEVSTMVWSSPHHRSYFQNASGTVTFPLTWRLVDYWNWTRSLDLKDYFVEAHKTPAQTG